MSKNRQPVVKKMLEKLPLKIAVALIVLGLLWWLWLANNTGAPNSNGESAQEGGVANQLVSSIQPISEENAELANFGSPANLAIESPPSQAVDQQLLSQFAQINKLIDSGRSDLAIPQLKALITQYPRVVEPYINLASLYAEANQLELAKQTISQGMSANPNTSTLFNSVQKIYAAQAAAAYKVALNAEEAPSQPLKLPRIASLDTREAQRDIVPQLQQQLARLQTQNTRLQGDYDELKKSSTVAVDNSSRNQQLLVERANKLSELQTQIGETNQTISRLKGAHQAEIALLREQLAKQTQLANAASEREQTLAAVAQQQALEIERATALAAVQAKQDAELAAQQRSQQQALLAQEKRDRELRDRELARVQAANEQATKDQVARARQQSKDLAVSLVKKWAADWSAQNVSSYVSNYAVNYTPPDSNINHEQWLEQRRVRLTNKKFINVDVSEFSLRDLGNTFSVTFTQHYRSNTVDDRIRKRLTFQKYGDDWSTAKIINERVISG